MVVQHKRFNAAYGYLNQGNGSNEFELFVGIPVEEGKLALFQEVKYISGLTLLNIQIVEDENKTGKLFDFKQIALNPGALDSSFDPETSFIRVVVSNGSEVIVSEFQYEDAGEAVLEEAEIINEIYYNAAYVHLAEWKDGEDVQMLAPRVLIPANGFFPTHVEEVAESVAQNIYNSILVLTPDSTIDKKVVVLEAVNELEYSENIQNEGYYTALSLKAQNDVDAEVLLNQAVQNTLDETQEAKTRKGRVRKRRTATRSQGGDQKENGSKPSEKQDKKVPPRKGKVRKKFTRTRDLEPVTKPNED